MNSLSDTEINEICTKMYLPLNGIYFKDSLPEILKVGFYIINLQSQNSLGRGTHWTTFYFDGNKNIYYDSFGFPAPEETEERIEPYIFNNRDIQNINSSSCGYYCIAFIKFLNGLSNKEKGFETFLKLFSDVTYKNERVLDSILYRS